jgi:peptidoglycan/xylan/chitin deacetylase (PgdA/CDA1 family)
VAARYGVVPANLRPTLDADRPMNTNLLQLCALVSLALVPPSACGEMRDAEADDAARRSAARPAAVEAGDTGQDRGRIAITIDDLPWLGPVPAGGVVSATDDLLAPLAERGIRATGFVVCQRLSEGSQGFEALRDWRRLGMGLGNHSMRHRDLNTARIETWLADVRGCDVALRQAGFEPHYFRYPMLHQGPTLERRDAALALLNELDYEIAHVTVDNSEYLLRQPFEAAQAAGDTAEMRRLGDLLVRHVVATVRHARLVARRKLGRDVHHVLLLHANALVAHNLEGLLEALEREGLEFISLEEALADPVYDLPDTYVGPKGVSWLYRIAPRRQQDVEWDEAQARWLREQLEEGAAGAPGWR